jgi:hypothetical protein
MERILAKPNRKIFEACLLFLPAKTLLGLDMIDVALLILPRFKRAPALGGA